MELWGYHPTYNRFLGPPTFSSPRGFLGFEEASSTMWFKVTFLFPIVGGHSNFERVTKTLHPKKVTIAELPGIALFSRKTGVFIHHFWSQEFSQIMKLSVKFQKMLFFVPGWWIPSQVGESHLRLVNPIPRHPSLPREKNVWLDPSNTVHLRKYDGMCRE